jgi:major type 1 subunit fimbrin (pilin)
MSKVMSVFSIRRVRKLVARFLMLACAVMLSKGALAACSGGPVSIVLPMASKIAVARDLPVGALLTSWVPANGIEWSCSTGQYQANGARITIGQFSTASGQTASDANGTYTVWNTNVPGIGIVVAMRFYVGSLGDCASGGAGWSTWRTPPGGWSGAVCPSANFAYTATYTSQVSVALVKTGAMAVGGTISGTVAQAAPVNITVSNTLTAQAASFVLSGTTIVPMTCTTPDVNVPMGTFKTTDFSSVGSLSPGSAAPVNLQFLNCPSVNTSSGGAAGTGQINAVKYYIQPTTTVATNVGGLTTGTGAATGVGIQLFTSAGTVFPLGATQTLSGYSSAGGGSYTVPLTARYYRTGTVTAGTANATMTLYVSYQ